MNKEKKKIKNQLNNLIEIFRIKDWNILLNEDVLEDCAYTKILYNDYKATITINISLSDEEKTKALIHELVHIIMRNTQQISYDNIKNEDVNKILERETERETEKIAKILYELYIKCEEAK